MNATCYVSAKFFLQQHSTKKTSQKSKANKPGEQISSIGKWIGIKRGGKRLS